MLSEKDPKSAAIMPTKGLEEQRRAAEAVVMRWCPDDADLILEMLGI
jgi:hypothetical protein